MMTNFPKITRVIVCFGCFLIIIGLLTHYWWQTKEELVKEVKEKEYTKEELAKQIQQNEELMEKIEGICGKLIKAPLIRLISFKADITLTDPKGDLVVGRWWDPEEKKYRVVEEEFGGMGL